MKKIFFTYGVSLLLSLLVLQIVTPAVVLGVASTGGTSSCTSGAASSGTGLQNPLKVDSIQCLISEVLKFVVNLLAVAGVMYIIWAGFLMVKAQGNPEELKKAKQAFLNAIIGMAIILGAWALAMMIAQTLTQVTGTPVTLPPQST